MHALQVASATSLPSAIPMSRVDVDPATRALKAELERTWRSGELGVPDTVLEQAARSFLRRQAIRPGQRVLDLACGDGSLSRAMAAAGARVTGIDLDPGAIERARSRPVEAGLAPTFDLGDVEDLPYADDAFDRVTSHFGVIYAPRPWIAISEMLRVLRPGGRIHLAAWTPRSFMARMLRMIADYLPPSPVMAPPELWGDEQTMRRRLGSAVEDLRFERFEIGLTHPNGARGMVGHLRETFGPISRAFTQLDGGSRMLLQANLEALWQANDRARGGPLCVGSEVLEIRATKA